LIGFKKKESNPLFALVYADLAPQMQIKSGQTIITINILILQRHIH
jgi:hypothetical protein